MTHDVEDSAELNEIKDQLQKEKAQLTERLAELGFGPGEGLYFDHNFADSSQVTAERGELERLARELKESLEEIEKALQKIDEGTYGICEGCRRAINKARLEAMPAVRYCIECASKRRA
jgi:DnaK suppressor protein